ncbi:NUDIX domain-containing protein [Micromonospora sonneratiae]|uniref:NUDIX domain-containing protein n=1 Tax=Micromonospora sonneratiae TaxID=1184706 RepID=A0ABW3YDF5_9ACTN
MTEEDFLAAYDPQAFPPVAVTADVVALTIRDDALHLLLIRRAEPPYSGFWALPGGFVRPDEDLAACARRELAEETGLGGERLRRVHLEQLASYSAPDRDPRMRVVSVAHLAFAPDLPDPAAGTDAEDAAWLPVADLPTRQLAFDHERIVADGLERARSKLEYTPLATRFLGDEFTIGELRAVYETVWGHALHAGNFHRKVLSVPGFVESTGVTTERGGARGGPRARLYRAGDARLLHPALLRPAREETIR